MDVIQKKLNFIMSRGKYKEVHVKNGHQSKVSHLKSH